MITATTLASLDQLYQQALLDGCRVGAQQDGLVTCGTGEERASELVGQDLVLLNISSYRFRLIHLFHFSDNDSMSRHLGSLLRSSEPLRGQPLLDAYGEVANLICGAVNRALCVPFHHVGMSTPLMLGSACLQHLEMLSLALRRCYQMQIGTDCRLSLTVGLMLTSGSSFEFQYEKQHVVEEQAGELEWF